MRDIPPDEARIEGGRFSHTECVTICICLSGNAVKVSLVVIVHFGCGQWPLCELHGSTVSSTLTLMLMNDRLNNPSLTQRATV